ncbi:MAG: tyrosine--tRNA ligase [Candidatus Daviesbacteria bacterium]|nr:tyrosine--tRNA ligase [Candidatus Daviesbacteria bacterium]
MTTEEKIKLITRNLEETLTTEELRQLIESEKPLKHYIGYEVSGKLHIGQGLLVMLKIKDLQEAGVKTTILIADWHTWLNNKLDGKLETANRLGKEYLIEVLKASALCVGADPLKIEFVLGSEVYGKLGLNYWATVVKVAKATSLSRMIRSTTIMGREESDISDSAMLIYPAMQSADIFMMGINIAHAGTDQRNVHVVAREAASELGYQKPVCIHGHLLQGLLPPIITENPETGKKEVDPESKMSKSKPNSGIYMIDSPIEIKEKINNAYCPEGEVEFNPILDWVKHLVLASQAEGWEVKRDEKFGGNVTYTSYEELEKDYEQKKLHPMDLKSAVAEWLINKLEPARKYFEDPKRKEALEEIERLTKK